MRSVRRSSRAAVAVLLGSSVLAAWPGRARAADAASEPPEIACSALSVGLPLVGIAGVLFASNAGSQRAWDVVLAVSGGAGLALGGTAIGLQAIRPGSCGDGCTAVYVAAGTGMALGAAALLVGIIDARSPGPRKPGGWNPSLMLLPTPLLLATARGPRLGLALTGVSF